MTGMTPHLFGPVPSRRLGRSLGVDLVPFKTCTFDCIYCQLGRTTVITTKREAFVEPQAILDEIRCKLADGVKPDIITLSGSGEPTLCLGLDQIIRGIKAITEIPVAVLTNGSLLGNKAVRQELLDADLVIPSLDVGDEKLYRYINRPGDEPGFGQLVEGLCSFRQAFPKPIWLEVFLLAGVNSAEADVRRIAECAKRIAPDKVQLNTVARPPAEDYALAVSVGQMEKLSRLFECKVEIISDTAGIHAEPDMRASQGDVLALLRRRPCTAKGIATGLGIHRNEAAKHLGELIKNGTVRTEYRNGEAFYLAIGEEREQ
jgi:wyosine [tRNA(Phe)-imidazoG37] synthetase (radical SAM superfamily)